MRLSVEPDRWLSWVLNSIGPRLLYTALRLVGLMAVIRHLFGLQQVAIPPPVLIGLSIPLGVSPWLLLLAVALGVVATMEEIPELMVLPCRLPLVLLLACQGFPLGLAGLPAPKPCRWSAGVVLMVTVASTVIQAQRLCPKAGPLAALPAAWGTAWFAGRH